MYSMIWPDRLRILLFVAGMLLTVTARSQSGPIVAVFEMEDRGSNLDKNVLLNLLEYMAARLTEGGYQVIPPEEIRSRLDQQKAETYKDCYAKSCQIELGKEIAAQKTFASKILRIGKTCQVTGVLYDLKKGATESAATAEGACEENDLLAAVKKITDKLNALLRTQEEKSAAALAPRAPVRPPPAPAQDPRAKQVAELEKYSRAIAPPRGTPEELETHKAKPKESSGLTRSGWGHLCFWSGTGLVALGAASFFLGKSEADKYEAGDVGARDKAQIWTATMLGSLGAGALLTTLGVVLWVGGKPEKEQVAEAGFLAAPGMDGRGLTVTFLGRW